MTDIEIVHAAVVALAQDHEFQHLLASAVGADSSERVVAYLMRRGVAEPLATNLACCFAFGQSTGIRAAARIVRGGSR